MNLKESFRYQLFLDSLLNEACRSIGDRLHGLIVTKRHLKNKANPDAEDMTEIVEQEQFVPNDIVINFMVWLTSEKGRLTTLISQAKGNGSLDIDAAIESNKYRQKVSLAIKNMLRFTPSVKTESGRDFKFNVEGNQVPYFYDIEVTSKEWFNRDVAKQTARELLRESDDRSSEIDAALINTEVNFSPKYNVNDTFEDVIMAYADEFFDGWRNSAK